MTGFPPAVFLIGAQKAGTTSLAQWLNRHPSIAVSDPKEPHFFTQHYQRGEDWYRQCFTGAGEDQIWLDASTSYAGAPLAETESARRSPLAGVPERIKALNSEARFIYIVREPVARTYSAYWHNVRTGDEKLDFWQALEDDWAYLQVSDYAAQLARYLDHFDLDRFLILTFEQFRDDPQTVVNQCVAFLGLNPLLLGEFEISEGKNRSYSYNWTGRIVTYLLHEGTMFKSMTQAAKRILPVGLYRAAGRALTREVPPMPEADRRALEDHFRSRNRAFRELTGLQTGYAE